MLKVYFAIYLEIAVNSNEIIIFVKGSYTVRVLGTLNTLEKLTVILIVCERCA